MRAKEYLESVSKKKAVVALMLGASEAALASSILPYIVNNLFFKRKSDGLDYSFDFFHFNCCKLCFVAGAHNYGEVRTGAITRYGSGFKLDVHLGELLKIVGSSANI
jgi:hypothetical protein